MKTQKYRPAIFTTLIFFTCVFIMPAVAISAEMTPSSMVFDDATYTDEVEKDHQKLHMLYAQATNKSLDLGQQERAKRDFFKLSQKLNKMMHNRVMSLNIKEGAALSHTDILLSTHLLLMTADMLSSMQQDIWENDPSMISGN